MHCDLSTHHSSPFTDPAPPGLSQVEYLVIYTKPARDTEPGQLAEIDGNGRVVCRIQNQS